jgi:hypothetical protein
MSDFTLLRPILEIPDIRISMISYIMDIGLSALSALSLQKEYTDETTNLSKDSTVDTGEKASGVAEKLMIFDCIQLCNYLLARGRILTRANKASTTPKN